MNILRKCAKALCSKLSIKIPLYLALLVLVAVALLIPRSIRDGQRRERALALGYLELAEEEFGWGLDAAVDRVEILEITGVASSAKETGLIDRFDTTGRIELSNEPAALFAQVWRRLDFDWGYSALCHDPGFIVRFFAGSRLVLETTVCFKCNNFVVPTDKGKTYMGFRLSNKSGSNFLGSVKALFPESSKWEKSEELTAPDQ